jgi:hypothetical protein
LWYNLGKAVKNYIIKGVITMKSCKLLVVGILVATIVFSLAGCGGGGNSDSDQTAAVVGGVSESTAPAEAETVVQGATQQVAEAVDTASNVDAIVGSWVDVNAPDRFAKITADGTAYIYEDNEGKYPATFEGGILKLKVSDTDTADVYIDPATEHLMMVYQDNVSEFSKK